MPIAVNMDVVTLDASHRQAIEDLLGQRLDVGQRLQIRVVGETPPACELPRPAQTVEDWAAVYAGLDDVEIDEVVQVRPDLYRMLA